MSVNRQTLIMEDDMSVYEECCKSACTNSAVLFQNTMKLEKADSFFYTTVILNDQVTVKALMDSGSMACTINEETECELLSTGLLIQPDQSHLDVLLVGCGGVKVKPKATHQLKMDVYGQLVSVPTLVVPGQRDQLILGTNVIKYLLTQLRKTPSYWKVMNYPETTGEPEIEQFLNMLAGSSRWKGNTIPDVVGTAKLAKAVTLLPGQEHFVWAKLPSVDPVSMGSTIVVEPPKAQTHKKGILVGRVIAHMSGDGWVPVRVMNLLDNPVILRRNTKIADVFPAVAVEDLDVYSGMENNGTVYGQNQGVTSVVGGEETRSDVNIHDSLRKLNLSDLNIDACEVSSYWKDQLGQLIGKHEDVFSKHKLDCGKANEFVHHIRLSDSRLFRLPYRRVPPSHYHKLRSVLSEMEEQEIIRKSHSEWASPLVLVWKKNGDLRVCVDYRWLNARPLRMPIHCPIKRIAWQL